MFFFGRKRKRKKAEAKIQSLMLEARQHFSKGFLDAGLDIAMKTVELGQKHLSRKYLLYPESLYLLADGYVMIGLYD